MASTGKPKKQHAAAAGPFAPRRWAALAGFVGVDPRAGVAVALSGGADSVYLLHVLAAAVPRPRLLAVHVDHRLRGAESERDARFAGALCDELKVPFQRVEAPVAPGAGLEARAREARYDALCRAARAADIGVIATGHHADDALETLLQRMARGTSLAGLAGLEKRVAITRAMSARAAQPVKGAEPIVLVRPLIGLRREEVRSTLKAHHVAWIEDSSNQSARFTRNRIRHELVPCIAEIGGEGALDNLRAFGAAIEEFEEHCAALTADLAWSAPVRAAARRGVRDIDCGGALPRPRLMQLPRALLARALWRLLTEGVGAAPSRAVLERIVADVASGRTGFHGLPRGFSLQLRSDVLLLEPPKPASPGVHATDAHATATLFDVATPTAELPLAVPGRATLADGRVIEARLLEVAVRASIPRGELQVELDADLLRGPLVVRFARAGDRFRGLGAPGSKPLARFLADAGVPRASRAAVPLVVAGGEIAWVAGIRPAARLRVTAHTTRRLVLSLVHAGLERAPRATGPRTRRLPFDER